ncbi:hypothetical protein ACQKGC_05675 [Allorhizobium pseudoryzae]|uniref:hypothetical protein n=1 Tax=Allorhizobium pseudoryzae TaxID=379684 RepID=UPI003D05D806
MDKEETETIRSLMRRVEELERQLEKLTDADEDTFAQDCLTDPPKMIFQLLIVELEQEFPGLTARLRQSIEQVCIGSIKGVLQKHPEARPLAEWQEARFRDIISEMLPPMDQCPAPTQDC